MYTPLIFLIFGALAIICVVRPHLILGPALCIYTFEQWALVHSYYFRSHPAAANYMFGFLCLIAIAGAVVKGRNPFVIPAGSTLMLALLYILATISWGWSIDPTLSATLWRFHLPYVVAFAVLVPLCIRTEQEMWEAAVFALVCGTITLLLLYTGTKVHAWGRTVEVSSSVADRSGRLATRLSPLAPAELAGHVLLLTGLLNFTGWMRVWKPLRWPVVLLAMLNLARAGSRGQLIGSLLPFAWLIGASRGYKKHFQLVIGLITFALLVGMTVWSLSMSGLEHTARRFDINKMESDMESTRLQMCMHVLDFWARSGPVAWIIGNGANSSMSPRVLGMYPHVLVVEVLAELGIIGLSLLLAYWALLAAEVRRWWIIAKDDTRRRGLIVAVTGMLTFTLLLTFKQGTLYSHVNMMMLSVVIQRVSRSVQLEAVVQHRASLRRMVVLKWLQLKSRHAGEASQPVPAATGG